MFFGISARSFSFSWGIKHRRDAAAMRCQELLLEPADRQHFAAQRDLAGHGHIALHRDVGQCRHQRCTHANSRARTVLRRGPFGHVNVHIELLVEVLIDAEHTPQRLRTTVIAAWIDSCMTSPSWPVCVSLPLPGTTALRWSAARRRPRSRPGRSPARPGRSLRLAVTDSAARPRYFSMLFGVTVTAGVARFQQQRLDDLAADLGNLALEVTHTRFARVVRMMSRTALVIRSSSP